VKYLGIDWGKRHIGLAISDGTLAEIYRELSVFSLQSAVKQIKKIVMDEGIDQIIVGLPDSGESRSMAEAGIKSLQAAGCRVQTTDETLTSYNSKGDHQKAAALILQEYLDHSYEKKESVA